MRGEKPLTVMIAPSGRGSPPHARGKVRDADGLEIFAGITPACAGKSFIALLNLPFNKDHPRMRGEKFRHPCRPVVHAGSPPHARGKVRWWRTGSRSARITPACAGKSALVADGISLSQDHPRMRGEKLKNS